MTVTFINRADEHFDREELIQELVADVRGDLESELEDSLDDFQAELEDFDNEALANEYRERMGDTLRIEEEGEADIEDVEECIEPEEHDE